MVFHLPWRGVGGAVMVGDVFFHSAAVQVSVAWFRCWISMLHAPVTKLEMTV